MNIHCRSQTSLAQMFLGKWSSCVVLFIIMSSCASGAFVGVNIGTDISDLPKASEIVSILRAKQIGHVRLFDADHQMLNALADTGIEVIVGIPNDQLGRIGSSQAAASDWVNKNIAAFVPATNITYIAVGDEVLTTAPDEAYVLLPAMQFLQSALQATNLNFEVKISSPQSMQMIPKPFPPSTATFNSTWNDTMNPFLQFLKNTKSSFMLNAHPYYIYTKGEGIFPIEFALFQSSRQIIDNNTLLHYSNMFDMMVDAAYYSMQALNNSGIPIMVTESGWPRLGGVNESEATVGNALVYNSNLIRHVLQGSGTPSQPAVEVSTYIYELFNEDLQPGATSEKNWGIAFPNGTVMYSLNFVTADNASAGLPAPNGLFCVADPRADIQALKVGLDWACGPGMADCSVIQPGQPCYVPDNLALVVSYAYNDYYHKTVLNGGTCSFGNTAMTTNTNPSHGACIFPGSTLPITNSSSGMNPSQVNGSSAPGAPVALGPSALENGVSALQLFGLTYMIPVILLVSFNL